MRVEVRISTYPLLSDELPESTMFPVMKTSHSNLLPHAPQLPDGHIASLYTTGYHSVALTTKNDLQFRLHLITAPYHHRTLWFCTAALSKSIYTVCDDSEEEEDFQTYALDDHHWITNHVPDRHLCIHEHLQSYSLCCYTCPYTDYTSTSYQDTLDLSDISDFEDVMTTSS